MGDNSDVNANQDCYATGDLQLDKAIYQWITWDRVSSYNVIIGNPTALCSRQHYC